MIASRPDVQALIEEAVQGIYNASNTDSVELLKAEAIEILLGLGKALSALSGEAETEWEYGLRAGDGTIFQPEGQKRPIGREVQVRRRPAGEWEVVA